MESFATALEEATSNAVGSCSARNIFRTLGLPFGTVRRVLVKLYDVNRTPNVEEFLASDLPKRANFALQLLASDLPKRANLALQLLARMEEDIIWPYNIFCTEEAHFNLQNAVMQKCQIWSTERVNTLQALPLHFSKVTVWCRFKAEFVLGSYFIEEATLKHPATFSRKQGTVTCFF